MPSFEVIDATEHDLRFSGHIDERSGLPVDCNVHGKDKDCFLRVLCNDWRDGVPFSVCYIYDNRFPDSGGWRYFQCHMKAGTLHGEDFAPHIGTEQTKKCKWREGQP